MRARYMCVPLATLLLSGCGKPSDPLADDKVVLGDCPRVLPGSANPCLGESAVFFIEGLDSHVVDATAPRLEARIRVGDTVDLHVTIRGCARIHETVAWGSTNPTVATVTPRLGKFVADLTGVSGGTSTAYADLTFVYHEGFRVYPALYAGGTCRKIEVISVVPQ